jgi:hypothetical protein
MNHFFQGKTFSSLINEQVTTSSLLNDHYLPIYNTPEGLQIYTETLEVVTNSFPQYLRELQGIADGANVDFFKVRIKKKICRILN